MLICQALLPLLVSGLRPQTSQTPILDFSFKSDAGGWIGAGSGGKVTVVHDSNLVGPSGGALKYDYDVATGGVSVLYLPTAVGTLAKAKSLKFRVKADATTMIGVVLQEQDGGRYVAMVTAPKDAWQPVELSTADFNLSLEANDPKDLDVKLDLDVVTSITLIDVSQFFAQADNPTLKDLLGVRTGAHSMYVEDFQVSSDPIAGSTANAGDDVVVETFAHPQLSWFTLGGGTLTKSSSGPINGTALKVEYKQVPRKIFGMTHSMSPWILTATKTFSFDVASTQPATLLVQLEENGGGKFNHTVTVPPGDSVSNIKLKYADFTTSDDSAVKDRPLDITKVKTLSIIDATGMSATAETSNTLWLGNFRALAK